MSFHTKKLKCFQKAIPMSHTSSLAHIRDIKFSLTLVKIAYMFYIS